MIATEQSFEPHSSDALPNSSRIYVEGTLPGVRVPMREITLSPTKAFNGRIEVNEPVRVYDTSGPWGDGDYKGTVQDGLPALREKWIADRGDVEAVDGRQATARDNGFLSETHMRTQAEKFAGGLSALEQPAGSANTCVVITGSSGGRRLSLTISTAL